LVPESPDGRCGTDQDAVLGENPDTLPLPQDAGYGLRVGSGIPSGRAKLTNRCQAVERLCHKNPPSIRNKFPHAFHVDGRDDNRSELKYAVVELNLIAQTTKGVALTLYFVSAQLPIDERDVRAATPTPDR
jgi:hypothetical protein